MIMLLADLLNEVLLGIAMLWIIVMFMLNYILKELTSLICGYVVRLAKYIMNSKFKHREVKSKKLIF